MKIKSIIMSAAATSIIVLSGCTTTASDVAASTTAQQHLVKATQVKVYYSNSEVPKHYTALGRVSAQSYNFVGMAIPQDSIFAELKKQAAAKGANGISQISTGMAQTTAVAIYSK